MIESLFVSSTEAHFTEVRILLTYEYAVLNDRAMAARREVADRYGEFATFLEGVVYLRTYELEPVVSITTDLTEDDAVSYTHLTLPTSDLV